MSNNLYRVTNPNNVQIWVSGGPNVQKPKLSKKNPKFPKKMRDERVTGNTDFFLCLMDKGHISCKGGQNYLEELVGVDGEDEPLEKYKSKLIPPLHTVRNTPIHCELNYSVGTIGHINQNRTFLLK